MTVHHFTHNDFLKEKCIYCGKELAKDSWKSDHIMQKHYKVNTCRKCGKEAKLEVDFDGDGADGWAIPVEQQMQKISRIREVKGHKKLENLL